MAAKNYFVFNNDCILLYRIVFHIYIIVLYTTHFKSWPVLSKEVILQFN